MLGYETHGTSFSDETMAKPMSHDLRAFVSSVNSCWPLLVAFSCFTNLGRFFFEFFLDHTEYQYQYFINGCQVGYQKNLRNNSTTDYLKSKG
jgi:hypothetical protein